MSRSVLVDFGGVVSVLRNQHKVLEDRLSLQTKLRRVHLHFDVDRRGAKRAMMRTVRGDGALAAHCSGLEFLGRDLRGASERN